MSKYTFPASLRESFPGKTDDELQSMYETALIALRHDKEAKKKLREGAKDQASDNLKKKRDYLVKISTDFGVRISKLVKSLHRTDKKVKVGEEVKIPQILVGAKGNLGGYAISLDFYIPTGKGAKVTPELEAKVAEVQALALEVMNTLEDNGFVVGEMAEDPDAT